MRKHIKGEISEFSNTIRAEGPLVTLRKYIARYQLIMKFLISGGTGAFTLLLLLFIFTDILGIWYLISSILAFVVAVFVSFTLQKFWTFRDKETLGLRKQLVSFLLLQIILITINTASVYLLVDIFGVWYLLAQFFVSLVLAIASFVFYRSRIFTNSDYQNILQPLDEK